MQTGRRSKAKQVILKVDDVLEKVSIKGQKQGHFGRAVMDADDGVPGATSRSTALINPEEEGLTPGWRAFANP